MKLLNYHKQPILAEYQSSPVPVEGKVVWVRAVHAGTGAFNAEVVPELVKAHAQLEGDAKLVVFTESAPPSLQQLYGSLSPTKLLMKIPQPYLADCDNHFSAIRIKYANLINGKLKPWPNSNPWGAELISWLATNQPNHILEQPSNVSCELIGCVRVLETFMAASVSCGNADDFEQFLLQWAALNTGARLARDLDARKTVREILKTKTNGVVVGIFGLNHDPEIVLAGISGTEIFAPFEALKSQLLSDFVAENSIQLEDCATEFLYEQLIVTLYNGGTFGVLAKSAADTALAYARDQHGTLVDLFRKCCKEKSLPNYVEILKASSIKPTANE